MNYRVIMEKISMNKENPGMYSEEGEFLIQFHRYLCSMADYVLRNDYVKPDERGEKPEDNPLNAVFSIHDMKLTLDDETVSIQRTEDLMEIISFAGAMPYAERVAYSANFLYNDRTLYFRQDQADDRPYRPFYEAFQEELENGELPASVAYQGVCQEEDVSLVSCVSKPAGDVRAYYDQEALTEGLKAAQPGAAWHFDFQHSCVSVPGRNEKLWEEALQRVQAIFNAEMYEDDDSDGYQVNIYEYDCESTEKIPELLRELEALDDWLKAQGGWMMIDGVALISSECDCLDMIRIKKEKDGPIEVRSGLL